MTYRSKKGSSSALIVMVLSMLAVFGVFTLLSAYVNVKFAEKTASWTRDFYLSDLEAERVLSKIDRIALDSAGSGRFESIQIKVRELYEAAKFERKDEMLYISIAAGEGDTQQVLLTLQVPPEDNAGCRVVRWTQQQESIGYDEPFGELWTGQ